ncbi:MAG: HesB/IscA family protein [Fimbriimonas sp.]
MNDTTFPVTVSGNALDQIRKILAKDGRPDAFLRLGVKGGGCSGLEYVLKLDAEQRGNDIVHEIDGIRLACDSKSAKFLEGAELVYTGNLIGGGFKFENPNAQRSCGCGTSFTPKKADQA